MKASELIKQIQRQIDEHGDLPVYCDNLDDFYYNFYVESVDYQSASKLEKECILLLPYSNDWK